jgi:hypothetical protein
MFWNKKPTAAKKFTAVNINEFAVKTRDGEMLYWVVEDWKGENIIEPWLEFYKWFFGRSGEVFVMRYNRGETMLMRADIMRFTVRVYEKGEPQINKENQTLADEEVER